MRTGARPTPSTASLTLGACSTLPASLSSWPSTRCGGANGYDAQRIADAWFKRDVGLGENQARGFYRAVCREMRLQYDEDTGPEPQQPLGGQHGLPHGHFMYESCKYQNGFDLCSNPFAMSVVDGWYEVKNCMFDMPQCRRERELCLGQLRWQRDAATPRLHDHGHQVRAQRARARQRPHRARPCQLLDQVAHL